jgi:hypothetical protein
MVACGVWMRGHRAGRDRGGERVCLEQCRHFYVGGAGSHVAASVEHVAHRRVAPTSCRDSPVRPAAA